MLPMFSGRKSSNPDEKLVVGGLFSRYYGVCELQGVCEFSLARGTPSVIEIGATATYSWSLRWDIRDREQRGAVHVERCWAPKRCRDLAGGRASWEERHYYQPHYNLPLTMINLTVLGLAIET